jgi:flagellar motor switch protein FliG
VQEARGTIVTVIRTLEESGQIVIHREGEDEYVE